MRRNLFFKRRKDVRWWDKDASGWRIDEGLGRALIAEGSGWSRQIGRELFHQLKWGVKMREFKRKEIENVNRPSSR